MPNGSAPDLVLIDGGPGQLVGRQPRSSPIWGWRMWRWWGFPRAPTATPAASISTFPGKEPFRLDLKSPVLYYLQRLRDEAHRFAIGSHRKKRSAAIGANPLDEVAGVGAGRKRALLQHFGSARAVAAASLTDLQSVAGVSGTLAKKIYDFFHPGERVTGKAGDRRRLLNWPHVRSAQRPHHPAHPAGAGFRRGLCDAGRRGARMVAVLVFALAGISDWLDGFAARKLKAGSDFGRMLDPIADKVLVARGADDAGGGRHLQPRTIPTTGQRSACCGWCRR